MREIRRLTDRQIRRVKIYEVSRLDVRTRLFKIQVADFDIIVEKVKSDASDVLFVDLDAVLFVVEGYVKHSF